MLRWYSRLMPGPSWHKGQWLHHDATVLDWSLDCNDLNCRPHLHRFALLSTP